MYILGEERREVRTWIYIIREGAGSEHIFFAEVERPEHIFGGRERDPNVYIMRDVHIFG